MTKKGHENFWLIKKKLGGKVIGKIFHRLFVTCCSETGGRMLHRLGGMDAPALQYYVSRPDEVLGLCPMPYISVTAYPTVHSCAIVS